jgi:hypothetical protein
VFREFISIFLSKLPDRLALVILVVSIICLGSFAYEHVGLPIQTASAQTLPNNTNATSIAVSWLSIQKCFGDNIMPGTINTTIQSASNGTYCMTVDFISMIYRVDPVTGGLHHVEQSHRVAVIVQNGMVVSAMENTRDLINGQIITPLSDVYRDFS